MGNLAFEDLRAMSLKELAWLLEFSKRSSVKLGAIREVISRTDPVPQTAVADASRPLAIQINIGLPGPAADADARLRPRGSLEIRLRGDQPNGSA